MQGKAILLSLLISNVLSVTHLSRFIVPNTKKDLDTEEAQFAEIHENNCGTLEGRALERIRNDTDKYSKLVGKYDEPAAISCKALTKADTIWVRLESSSETEECRAFVPFNTISMFHEDTEKYPHLHTDYADSTHHYNDCKSKAQKQDEDDEDMIHLRNRVNALLAEYVNNVATPKTIADSEMPEEDQEKLTKYVSNDSEFVHNVQDLDISQEAQEVLKNEMLEKASEKDLTDIINNNDTKVDLAAQPKEALQTLPYDSNKKYLSPEQLSETATVCTAQDIKRTASLYRAMATKKQMPTYKFYNQNIAECITDLNGKRFKAVLALGEKGCLINMAFNKDNKLGAIDSEVVPLVGCHKLVRSA